MTHIENIAHILQYGITHINSNNRNHNYVAIGDISLISNRDNFQLPNGKQLGSYIPFYFGTRMPMLFVIQKGFNNVKKTSSEDIIYCITTVQQIIDHKLDFIFSDGHGVDELTDFFEPKRINDILEIIDEKAIKEKYWKDENDLDLKRRKEAEFLISNDIPITAISGYAVYNIETQQKLVALGIEEKSIVIRPNYYF
jgi:hypothetical protein